MITLSGTVLAQGTIVKYERKSISYINALWKADRRMKITPEETRYILDKIKENIELPRFEYTPLADEIVAKFVRKANMAPDSLSVDQVADLLTETVAPVLVAALDAKKELLAKEFLTEADRNRFITDKAKELGITAEHLEKVMNSAYMYMPVLTKFEKEVKDDEISVTIGGGIIWYHLTTKTTPSRVHLVVKNSTVSSGVAKKGKTYVYPIRKLSLTELILKTAKIKEKMANEISAEEFAYRTAVDNFARNLQVATQQIPEFLICDALAETGTFSVSFETFGRKEGLRIDDKYKVGEFVEDEEGNVKLETLGFVRVTKVGSPPESFTRAAIVTGRGYEPGMIAVEHPRVPIDVAFQAKVFALELKKGAMLGLEVKKDIKGVLGGEISAKYNVGRYIGICQLFLDLHGAYGWAPTEAELVGKKTNSVSYMSLGGGFTKKFYIRRMALSLGGLYGQQSISLSKKGDTFSNTSNGLAAYGGLEVAINPDFNFGLTVGYRLFGESDEWTYKPKKGGEVTLYGLKVVHGGPSIGLYLIYSPPSLPFDPFSYLRGKLGV